MLDYGPMIEGVFLCRSNRFVAHVLLDGREVVCHVKNTGRLNELLIPGAKVRCQYHADPKRKTAWSLILVQRGTQWVCIDSQAPNRLARQWLEAGGLGFLPEQVRTECPYGASRLDLAFMRDGRQALMEVKGVTLLCDGVARFPDAPTQRGIRHLQELQRAVQAGLDAYVLFVIQMSGAACFAPNRANGPEFADVLQQAAQNGVRVLAVDCTVCDHGIAVHRLVPVDLIR